MLQNSTNKEILDLTILTYSIVVVVVLSFTIVMFFLAFIKRKNKLLIEKLEQQQRFDEELVRAQQEMQDETFKQVGQELHDNVGQLLALTSMHLNSAKSAGQDHVQEKMKLASDSLKTSLEEVRALSKSLNSDVILNTSFKDILSNEIDRLKKLGTITFNLLITGDHKALNSDKDRLMLFRIIQEFISNALKYSEASSINIELSYSSEFLNIKVWDDGIGFKQDEVVKGSGLINMEKRAALINTGFNLFSQQDQGTSLELKYPFL